MANSGRFPWTIRRYEAGDEEQIISLLTNCFDKEMQPEIMFLDYWQWKYGERFEGTSEVFVVTHEEKIIGHYGFLPLRIMHEGNQLHAMLAVDAAIHPSYRRQGIFYELSKYALTALIQKGYPFIIGFTPSTRDSTVLPGHKKVGWLTPFKISIFGYPLKPRAVSNARFSSFYFSRIASTILTILVKSILKWKFSVDYEYSFTQVDTFDSKLEEFMNEVAQDYSFMRQRSIATFKWRFLENPHRDYWSYVCRKDEEIYGFLVLRSFTHLGMKTLFIVDLITRKDDIRTRETLLDFVYRIGGSLDADLIACMINDYESEKVLRRKGFIRTGEDYSFVLKKNNSLFPKAKLNDKDSWFFTWFDFDVI